MEQDKWKSLRLSSLIYHAKRGDMDALEELYERLLPVILKHVSKMRVDYRKEAKNVLLLELMEAIKRFEPNSNWGKTELQQHIAKFKETDETD